MIVYEGNKHIFLDDIIRIKKTIVIDSKQLEKCLAIKTRKIFYKESKMCI